MAVRLKSKLDELNKRLDRLGQTAQARAQVGNIVIYDPNNPPQKVLESAEIMAASLVSGTYQAATGEGGPVTVYLPDNGRDTLNELERQEQEAGIISQQPEPGPQPGRAAPVSEWPGSEPETEYMLFETWFRIYSGKPEAADWEDPHKYVEELPPKKYMIQVKGQQARPNRRAGLKPTPGPALGRSAREGSNYG